MLPAKLHDRLYREDWNIGLVHQSIAGIVRHGITEPVHWFTRQGIWKMLADPYCYMKDGRLVILVERLDYWVGRGEIWQTEMHPKTDPATAKFKPLIVDAAHLSYPFPVSEGDEHYLAVESWEHNALQLWQERAGHWKPVHTILHGQIIDATLWGPSPNGWWLFCTMRDDRPNERLYLFFADHPTGPWTPHPGNPVKDDISSSRPGGPLFVVDGKLHRPTQDCSETYGGALTINEVIHLDKKYFVERTVQRLTPIAPYSDGLHTICPAGDVTVIDGKRWAFNGLDIVRNVVVRGRNWQRRRQLGGVLPSPKQGENL